MALEALKQFADELKSAREQKDITLQQISNQTKIDIRFLQNIEDANFDFLPEIYVRAFIKEYAQSINLNPNEIISKYDRAKGSIKDNNEKKTQIKKQNEEVFQEITESKNNKFPEFDDEKYFSPSLESIENIGTKSVLPKKIFISSIVFIFFLLFIYLIFIRNNTENIVEETPYQDIVTERYKIDSSKIQSNMLEKSDSLTLSIIPLNNVWLKVLSDNKEVLVRTVKADQTLNFRALKEFYVVVGNAGSIKMSLDNKPITQIGNPGEIRRYFITRDSIKSFLIPVQKKNEEGSQKED